MDQPEMKIDFIQALHRLHIYAWPSWCCLCIIRRHSTPLQPNHNDLCWPTRRITSRYSHKRKWIFGMVVIGGLCMKICNFVVLVLLVRPVHSQKAFKTTTPEPTRFMLTHSAYYLSICLWMEVHLWNGCNWSFVREIMQFCCVGAAGTSCT